MSTKGPRVVCGALLLSLLPGLSVAGWEELGPIRNASLTELVRASDGWQSQVRCSDCGPRSRGCV